MIKKTLWVLAILALSLAGCSGAENSNLSSSPTEVVAPVVTPYHTVVPLQTEAPTETPAPTSTPPPLPTPTPFVHTITEGQTMIGIANYYGVSLDALGVANPDVDPNYLSVGAQLIIPLGVDGESDEPQPLSAAEVLPLTGGEVFCAPNRVGGMWCFWPVTNSLSESVENLAGILRLYDQEGEYLLSQAAYSLLNLLKPGETITLGAYFKPLLPDWQVVQGQVTSASVANLAGERYLETSVSGLSVSPMDDSGLVSQVSGTISILGLAAEAVPAYVWVVATAYDAAGQVVALRRWEAGAEALAENPGQTVEFSFVIYSLGKQISEVEILTEARILGE